MKIAFLSRRFKTVNRGGETFVKELSKRLEEEHQVTILYGEDADSFKKMVEGHYDLIISMDGRLQSFKASIARLFSKHKLLISSQSGIGRDDIWNIVVARPDIFVATTEKIRKWAKKWAWGSKVIKIPNGVDIEKFNPAGQKFDHNLKGKVILSVGALVWYKYHERVIEAASLLEGVSVLIIGRGEDYQKLLGLGRQKLGNDRFKIMELPYEELPDVYRSVDVFTLPSWDRESFGIVYLEALASNLPVVAPNDLSRQEIVGEGGILVQVENIEEFAKSLKEALSRNWGDIPREQAEKFSWDKIAKEYQKCLEKL